MARVMLPHAPGQQDQKSELPRLGRRRHELIRGCIIVYQAQCTRSRSRIGRAGAEKGESLCRHFLLLASSMQLAWGQKLGRCKAEFELGNFRVRRLLIVRLRGHVRIHHAITMSLFN